MDRSLLVTVGVVALAATVASAATYAFLGGDGPPSTSPASPPASPPPPPPPAGNVTAPPDGASTGNTTGGGGGEELWAFVLEGETPPGPNQAGPAGTVVAILTRLQGDRNLSASNGSISVELAAVNWTAFSLRPQPNGTILGALNQRFGVAPPVGLVRAAFSRHGDGAELTVPQGRGVASVVVHAPATGEFLIVDWPSGGVYGWSEQEQQWGVLPGDRPPTLLARTPT